MLAWPKERRRLRVTTGCRTCRARHVKCDERRPSCRQCSKKGRNCHYDRSSNSSGATDKRTITKDPPVQLNARYVKSAIAQSSTGPEHSDVELQQLRYRNDEFPELQDSRQEQSQILAPSSAQASPSANLASIFSVADGLPQDREIQAVPELRTREPRQLTGVEVVVFRNYVNRVARWLDAFSRDRPFQCVVPSLALHCPVLMNSCLAFSARQMALSAAGTNVQRYNNLALYHYRTALKSLGDLLANEECARSDEILASSMILSSYEMLEVIGESFASHLKGLAALLQAQGVKGDDSGVRGSVFWAWYRHECWSCLLTEREMTLDEKYWQPESVASFNAMTQEEIANRITFIYGQVVSFSNETTLSTDAKYTDARKARAEALEMALADWKHKLPSWMVGFEMESASSLWFIYPQIAVAHQAYHAAQILLALHRPQQGSLASGLGRQPSLATRRHIERSREQICIVGASKLPEEQAFVSIHLLFVAGLVTEGKAERQQTLDIIEDCQRISGRRTVCIANELRKIWALER